MDLGGNLLRIGQVAQLSGLSARTIDYYTQRGLLSYERSSANYRLYHENVLHTLERIKLLKQQRMSLAEIEETIQLASNEKLEPIIDEVQGEITLLRQKLLKLEEIMKDAPQREKDVVCEKLTYRLSSVMQLLAAL